MQVGVIYWQMATQATYVFWPKTENQPAPKTSCFIDFFCLFKHPDLVVNYWRVFLEKIFPNNDGKQWWDSCHNLCSELFWSEYARAAVLIYFHYFPIIQFFLEKSQWTLRALRTRVKRQINKKLTKIYLASILRFIWFISSRAMLLNANCNQYIQLAREQIS